MEGLEFVKRQGQEKIYSEEMAKVNYLRNKLSQLPKVKLYTPAPKAPWFVPVLSFNVEGLPSETVGDVLGKAGIAVRCGLHCAPAAHRKFGTLQGGTVRASPSVFTKREELDALARTVSRI